MTLWLASSDLRLSAGNRVAATVAKSLRLEVEAGRATAADNLGLSYSSTDLGMRDSSG